MNKKRDKSATFNRLVSAIEKINNRFSSQVSRAVNVSLTLRNWLIGSYITGYELKGTDRAKYGSDFYNRLSATLGRHAVPGINPRELRRYRMFYNVYPEIWQTVSAKFHLSAGDLGVSVPQIMQLTSDNDNPEVPALIEKLSFSHISELIAIEDDAKRKFYETECIRGGWSVRELERQINSLYYERTGLSKNKKKMSAMTQAKSEKESRELNIRDPYVFEFLGIKPREVMSESRLEAALTDKLQNFILELGHGFCFEARQKRILIGDENGFVDLVFYHRILKCHVLVELKTGKFSHESIGQLNTYVSWYKKNMMQKGDNPPIGILLCTDRNHALVEYALAGMDNKLFVSKYRVHLPTEKELIREIEKEKDDFMLKEETAAYGRGMKARKLNSRAEKALRQWENADEKDRQCILSNVYCTRCRDGVQIAEGWTIAIEGTAPVIRGNCAQCGQVVARVLDIC